MEGSSKIEVPELVEGPGVGTMSKSSRRQSSATKSLDSIRDDGNTLTAGVDEAGRGCLAGPVVAAAVILDPESPIEGLNDSKVLSESSRNSLYSQIIKNSKAVGIAIVAPSTIERLNILHASLYAMRRSVEKLGLRPDHVWVDGNKTPEMGDIPVQAFVKGDALHACISAASIVAKVVRDTQMKKYNDRYPGYGLDRHKGYATAAHYDALLALGPCPIHRKGFKLVRQETLFEL